MLSQEVRDKVAEAFGCAFDVMAGESDRGSALVGAAVLEDALTEALRKYLIAAPGSRDALLDGQDATFSMKIELAYRVGLIRSSVRELLNQVRRIRNEFAHSPADMSFTCQSVSDRVQNICDLTEDFLEPLVEPLREHGIDLGEHASGEALIKVAGNRTAFDTVVSIHRGGLEYLYGEVESLEPPA